MPLDITRVDNAVLAGKNKVKSFETRWRQRFYKPVIDAQIAQMWQETPDEIKALAYETNPDAVQRIEKKFGGK